MSFPADSSLVSSVLPEPNHSGPSSKNYVVVHDIECPPGKNWAESLGGPSYLQNPSEQHSVHYVVDADSVIQGLQESLWAWGTGTPGSAHGIHIEQAGYAAFTRDQWLGNSAAIGSTYQRPNGSNATYTAQDATDMASQINLLARLIADIHKRHGWSNVGWMTDDEVRSASQGNSTTNHMTTHLQITNSVGGTVHTDPGPNYPKDVLISKVSTIVGGGVIAPIVPPKPTPPKEDDMPLNDADKAWITETIRTTVAAAIHADNVRQAQVIVGKHINAHYTQAEVNGVYAPGTAGSLLEKTSSITSVLTSLATAIKGVVKK